MSSGRSIHFSPYGRVLYSKDSISTDWLCVTQLVQVDLGHETGQTGTYTYSGDSDQISCHQTQNNFAYAFEAPLQQASHVLDSSEFSDQVVITTDLYRSKYSDYYFVAMSHCSNYTYIFFHM